VVSAVVVAGVAAAVVIETSSDSVPAPRARMYANVDACLLTGPGGISSEPDSLIWSGMESVSVSTRTRVSYLAAEGPATEANVADFLGSLLVRGCRVIVAADAPERAAVAAEATKFPEVRFGVVGAVRPTASNVTVVPSSLAGLQKFVAGAVS